MKDTHKVLLTEDGSGLGASCIGELRKHGLEIVTCDRNGEEVLRCVEQQTPDVVVMDAFLSHKDALAVLKELRQMQLPTRPLIFLLAGVDNPRFEQEALQLGVDYYFLKPFDVKMLSERVMQLLGWNQNEHDDAITVVRSRSDLELMISELMRQVGVPAHIRGYQYLREAIFLAIYDTNMIASVTKLLYPSVAKVFDTTPSRVERAIRHAIEVAWNRGNSEVLSSYFGYTIQTERGKPTNSEFVAMISDKLRLQLRVSAA